jgi:hypothetical protein
MTSAPAAPSTCDRRRRPEYPPTFALLHSPFLGPRSWRAVADALLDLEKRALLVDMSAALRVQRGFYDAFAAAVAGQIRERAILVVHSGAGALVPSILRASGSIEAVIFVDALLPHPGRSWFDTAPAALAARLRGDSSAGCAPPWPKWLPGDVLERLLPDAGMRDSLAADAPAVPLAFLDEPASDWPAPAPPRGCAYLQMSSGYDHEAREARAAGWLAERLDGHHLSIMTNPSLVAAAIADLAVRLSEAA